MKNPFTVILVLGLLFSCLWCVKAQSSVDFPELYEGIEFDMPSVQETNIPEYAASIMEFGAVGDGLVKNTEAISKAMDHLKKRVRKAFFPRGIWFHAESGITAIDTEGLILNNVVMVSEVDAALTIYNSKNLEVKNFSFEDNGKAAVKVLGDLSQNLHFKKKDFQDLDMQMYKGDGIPANAITIQ